MSKIMEYFLNFEDNYDVKKRLVSKMLDVLFISMAVAFAFLVNEWDFNKIRLPLNFFMLSFFLSMLFKKEIDFRSILSDQVLDVVAAFLGIIIILNYSHNIPKSLVSF